MDSLGKENFRTESLKCPYGIKAKYNKIVCVIKFLNVPTFVSCPKKIRLMHIFIVEVMFE